MVMLSVVQKDDETFRFDPEIVVVLVRKFEVVNETSNAFSTRGKEALMS